MTPTFTPGPWRRLSHRLIVAGEGEQTKPVCEVWSRGVGNGEADANEYLIAAAPELYRALEDLLKQVKRAAVAKDTFLTGLAASALQTAQVGVRTRAPVQSPHLRR